MESSFAWRYANAREAKFQFRLKQDTTTSIEPNIQHRTSGIVIPKTY
jgi:hypothetical protein